MACLAKKLLISSGRHPSCNDTTGEQHSVQTKCYSKSLLVEIENFDNLCGTQPVHRSFDVYVKNRHINRDKTPFPTQTSGKVSNEPRGDYPRFPRCKCSILPRYRSLLYVSTKEKLCLISLILPTRAHRAGYYRTEGGKISYTKLVCLAESPII